MAAEQERSRIRIAAVADIHYPHGTDASTVPQLAKAAEGADVLLLCGDLTHHGLPEEAIELGRLLAKVQIPILAVLGNHDFHSGQQQEIQRILKDSPVRILDGDAVEIKGVGFAGVKGFASGFGKHVLEPWGETAVKQFVREAVEEALKLGSALAQLRTERRVALLHYAPVVETVLGEPPEVHAFLGSTRLEEPLNRFEVAAVFHGHAHHGRPEGRTTTGIPVYNVSLPLMRRTDAAMLVRMVDLDGAAAP
ncbi:MAG: metallophosphoesterase family protein [Bacteroidota bacterium]